MDESTNIVYVLTNPAMPGLVKIGKTSQSEPNTRISQLYTTGVPVPFKVEYACKVSNYGDVEKALHTAFAPQRINPKREFFQIEPEQAIVILKLLSTDDVTVDVENSDLEEVDEQDKLAAEKLRNRRPNLNFDEMGIPRGATLHFVNTNDTATVVDAKKVEFRGNKLISLTAATRELLGLTYSVSPAQYWTYNGQSLKKIYEDTYSTDY